MTDQLEQEIERVLREAGENAPTPPPGLLARIDDRAHRRRRTRIGTGAVCLAAAAAVTAVAIASGVVRAPNATPQPMQTPTKTMVEGVKILPPKPAEELWPEAVHQINGYLPKDRHLVPMDFIDNENLLVGIVEVGGAKEALYRYELATRKVTKLTDIGVPMEADGFTISGGWIVWYVESETHGEIFGVPVAGGQVRQLATGVPGEGIEGIAVDGDSVYWASSNGTSVRILSAPFGGMAKEVPNSDDAMIVSWPWIGSPIPPVEPVPGIAFRDLRNVRTGETRTATDRTGTWACHLTWCVGGTDKQVFVERRDGTQRQQLPSIGINLTDRVLNPPVRDRFVISGREVIDLATGKHGQLTTYPNSSRHTPRDRMHLASTKDGGYEVIDLAAIP
ncbi:TolB family protein [Tenggerimyces flavus]|uniref:TolB family protein n=1 Tax=Tenggerimyces flavus TaxID=1708749 RepID=A0ABV7YG30_9ACTN|nr:hypothetical protein [Tenggerimyces flavus]MBM7787878.1 hypothetical protein [Tenggerimyces flavus]